MEVSPIGEKTVPIMPAVHPIGRGIASATPLAQLTANRIDQIISSLPGLTASDLDHLQATIAKLKQQKASA